APTRGSSPHSSLPKRFPPFPWPAIPGGASSWFRPITWWGACGFATISLARLLPFIDNRIRLVQDPLSRTTPILTRQTVDPFEDTVPAAPDPDRPLPTGGTGHKAWYRKLERTLDAIERSEDVGGMLSSAMDSIVRDFREELGVVGGRL